MSLLHTVTRLFLGSWGKFEGELSKSEDWTVEGGEAKEERPYRWLQGGNARTCAIRRLTGELLMVSKHSRRAPSMDENHSIL